MITVAISVDRRCSVDDRIEAHRHHCNGPQRPARCGAKTKAIAYRGRETVGPYGIRTETIHQ
jgi:hypothetical protein